jgi:hypothetical protein
MVPAAVAVVTPFRVPETRRKKVSGTIASGSDLPHPNHRGV